MEDTTFEHIVTLFSNLNNEEKQTILKVLSSVEEKSTSISAFCERHQKQFRSNIEFIIHKELVDKKDIITAIAKTAYGEFSGKGSNQKIAKHNAIVQAENKWNNILKKTI